MDMEVVRSSIIAALLFLTLVVLAAASGGGGDDAAVGVLAGKKQCHPLADDGEGYELITFKNKDGEEIRLLAHQRSTTGFANRSGNWFYSIRDRDREGKRRRRLALLPQQSNDDNRSSSRGGSRTGRAEGLWNTLGVLVNTTAAATGDPATGDDDEPYYMIIGLQTGGGDKNRLVLVADQRYFSIAGFAQGFSYRPRWFFRAAGEPHRLLPTSGGDAGSHHGSGSGSSHAEFVASNLLAALMEVGSSCGCG